MNETTLLLICMGLFVFSFVATKVLGRVLLGS